MSSIKCRNRTPKGNTMLYLLCEHDKGTEVMGVSLMSSPLRCAWSKQVFSSYLYKAVSLRPEKTKASHVRLNSKPLMNADAKRARNIVDVQREVFFLRTWVELLSVPWRNRERSLMWASGPRTLEVGKNTFWAVCIHFTALSLLTS